MSEIVSINYCQPATKFHVWIFTATHKSDPGTNKYLCALSRLAQRAHISHHNFYPSAILTFVSLKTYHKGQDATNKMSWYTFGCPMILHLSDVTALNEAWKRGYWDQSMRAQLGTGRRAGRPAQTRWQTERRARRRINPRYHELFRAAQLRGKLPCIVSPLCTGRGA